MTKQEILATIEEIGIVPAVRVSSPSDAIFASQAVFNSGIPVVEITVTRTGAVEVISDLVRNNPNVIVGAGTVLDVNTAAACLDAGAAFLSSTGLDSELIDFAHRHDATLIPGALTPTEVLMAKRSGSSFIKIFPCSSLGGPSYIRALRVPFPNTHFIASGGVNQQNAADYIRAGASVLGVGRDLLPHEAICARNSAWIQELARRFIGMVKQGRNRKLANGVLHHKER